MGVRGAGGHIDGVSVQKAASTSWAWNLDRPPKLDCRVLEGVCSPLSGPRIEESWLGSLQACKYLTSNHHEKDPRPQASGPGAAVPGQCPHACLALGPVPAVQ